MPPSGPRPGGGWAVAVGVKPHGGLGEATRGQGAAPPPRRGGQPPGCRRPPRRVAQGARAAGAPLIRDDKDGQTDNHIYHWESGDAAATEAAFAGADKVVSLSTHYPRSHPAPLETCGILADVNPATGRATLYMTSQAPHAIRTVFALVAGVPPAEHPALSAPTGPGVRPQQAPHPRGAVGYPPRLL